MGTARHLRAGPNCQYEAMTCCALAFVFALLASGCSAGRQYLGPDDFDHPGIPYTARIPYGPDSLQHGDLRLPEGPGPHPVAIIIHGGCWRNWHTHHHMEPVAKVITDAGWATWNLEYRAVDRPGGGWPGTLQDVGAGADHLREVAKRFPLDLTSVVTIGHSAGGHLALWLAGRHRISAGATLWVNEPLPIAGAVGLGSIADLRTYRDSVGGGCDAGIPLLVGDTPRNAPERYSQASPGDLLPIAVPQLLLHGIDDRNVPLSHTRGYTELARRRGDDVRLVVIPEAAHFELIAPRAEAWARVEKPLLEFLRERAP